MRKVLITDDVSAVLLEGLPGLGYTFDYIPNITFREVKDSIHEYEGLVINSKVFCGDELLRNASNLKWIGRLGSGMEVIDTVVCDTRGIKYFNTPSGNCKAVAEHTLGLLLSLMHNISKANYEVKNWQWIREQNRGEELSGKTVGILGYGHTGEAFAKVLSGFDVKVLAFDKHRKDFASGSVFESNYEEIFEQADILSIHLPLTDETTFSIDFNFLNSFKKPIFLVNTSRGKVLTTADLIALVESGKIKAAALDVLENEKLSELSQQEKDVFQLLIKCERIILTPHIAGWTHESKRKIAQKLLEHIALFSA